MSQADPSTSPHAIQPPPPPPAPDPAILATPAPISYAPYLDKQDPALLTAWRRLEDYSYVSTDRKVAYTRLRSAVIWTGFATSALAVLSAYIPDWLASVGLMGAFSEVATFLIRAALVVLPILSVGLMTYTNQFASSVAWIEYRISAEIIRQHIYRYRMGAGRFRGMDRQQAQRQLLAVVRAADERLARRKVTIPDIRQPEADMVNKINRRLGEGDDGFAPLSPETYISARVEQQIGWYIDKLQDDYAQLRMNRVLALTISGIGAVIAALLPSLEGLVAITTALGVAFGLRNDTRMFGATYGIYHITAQRLQMMIAEWQVLTAEERQEPAKFQDFVARVEDMLYEEGKIWRQTAIQLQSNSEEALQNMLRNTKTPTEGEPRDTKLVSDEDDLDDLIGPPPAVGAASMTSSALLLPDESDADAIRWEQQPQAANGKAQG